MKTYDDKLQVKDALNIYFSNYHFKDGGYNLKWFKVKLGPVFIPLPNIKDRVDAVKIHDLHHIVTEYTAVYKGEAEIGAWEIATGCGKYYVAWILNFGSFLIGMIFYPRALFKAFMRGRTCATNFYKNHEYEIITKKTVGELRTLIAIDTSNTITIKDYLAFVLCCIITLVYHIAIFWLFVFAICKICEILF